MEIMRERYQASRAVGAAIRGVSYLLMLLGGAGVFAGLVMSVGGNRDGQVIAVTGLIMVPFGLVLLLSGELIRILIDVEENTRRGSWATVMQLSPEQRKGFDLPFGDSGFDAGGTNPAMSQASTPATLDLKQEIVRTKQLYERSPGDTRVALKLSELYCQLYREQGTDLQKDSAIDYYELALEDDPELLVSDTASQVLQLFTDEPRIERIKKKQNKLAAKS